MRPALLLLAGAAAATAGCGDPLVGDGYRGEPLFKARGQILAVPAPVPGEEQLYRASVFWLTGGQRVEQPSISTQVFLPDVFDVIFFDPPEAAHYMSRDPRFALGLLVVYRDVDRDVRYGGEDTILAATLDHGFLYSPEAIAAERSPTGEEARPGFSVVSLPIACPPHPGPPELAGDPPAAARSCAERACGSGETCDPVHHICVPDVPLALQVSLDIDLDAIRCR